MGYRRLGHTADTGLEVWGESLPVLFGEAVRGLTDTVIRLSRVEERIATRIVCTAAAPDLLLVAWLEELLYEFEVRSLVYRRAQVELERRGEPWRLVGLLHGERYRAERHGLRVPIKGVTYHRLELVERAGEWRGRVVFDI